MGMWGDTGIATVAAVGRYLPQHMQTELFPSQDLQQSRGDLFQCPQGTRQGPHEPEPAPAEPHLLVWPVCLSICCAWLLVMGQFAGVGGSQIVLGGGAGSTPEEARWLLSFPLLEIRAEPPELPWLLHAASCSSSINTTGKSINFTTLIDVLL